jgi:hypothetical protein
VTDTLTDSRGQTWSRKRWTAAELAAATPPIVAASGTVVSITIILDEGTDAGPDFTGQSFLDNFDVNGALMGKPGNANTPH